MQAVTGACATSHKVSVSPFNNHMVIADVLTSQRATPVEPQAFCNHLAVVQQWPHAAGVKPGPTLAAFCLKHGCQNLLQQLPLLLACTMRDHQKVTRACVATNA